ncbi:MAG TPA: methyl-accepting chemotaxis protein, partial [Burkholderiaceae bacterium]
MSFLNKITGRGQNGEGATAPAAPEPGTPSGYEVPTQQPTQEADTSIITAAAPSEMPDFVETRLQDGDARLAAGTGLPLIGKLPVAQQQRILFVMAGLGLAGLILMTVLSLLAA